jgi:tetratricopeptide (TPR) repeat protein
MSDRKRYAIVTPYHREEKWLVERCIRSVLAQTRSADHFLIADGFPQDWIDDEPVRHLKLDREHANFGNTPRTIGALLAVSEGYDGIGFLDADNWLQEDHVSRCIEASERNEDCDYVIAQRNLCRLDGSVMDIADPPIATHVDTSCFFLLPRSYQIIPHFALMPIELSPICDRVFYWALKAEKLKPQVVRERTVNYYSKWPDHYRKAGDTPPPDVTHRIDFERMRDWLQSCTPRQLEIILRRCGSPAVLEHLVTFPRACQLHQEGQFEEAERLYESILNADPDSPNVLQLLGVLYARRGDHERAAELIGRAVALDPDNAVACYNHGKALRDANRYEEALASCDRAVALQPESVEAWNSRGAVLQDLGRLNEAIHSFDRALAINPAHTSSRDNRAKALRDLNNAEAAAG